MPPAGINMDLIREALARRMQGGGGTPMVDQQTQPTGSTVAGGPNNMAGAQPQMPQAQPRSVNAGAPAGGGQNPTNQAMKAAGTANSPQFDDDTRVTAKALIAKLLKVM
jgi:hypothetical protein